MFRLRAWARGSGVRHLFYDYRTNVENYPRWQAWMREKQPRLLAGQFCLWT